MAGDMARRQLRRMFPLVQLLMFSQACLFMSEPTAPQRLWHFVPALSLLNTQAAMALPAKVVQQQTAQDLALPENVLNTIYGFLGVIATTLLVNIVTFIAGITQLSSLKTNVQNLNTKVEGLRDKVDGLKEQMVTKADLEQTKADLEQKVVGLKEQIVTKTDIALFVVL